MEDLAISAAAEPPSLAPVRALAPTMPDDHGAFDDPIERTVVRLQRLSRRSTLQFAIEVGRLIITELYDGDVTSWRSRNPQKSSSFRKLARHPRLPMSPTTLYRSVAMFEVYDRLGGEAWNHLSTSHLRLVLLLPPAEQDRLLRLAEDQRWTPHRLQADVAATIALNRGEVATRGGRRPRLHGPQWVKSVAKLASTLDRALSAGDEAAGGPVDDAGDVLVLLRRVAEQCARLEARIHAPGPDARSAPAFTEDHPVMSRRAV